MRKHTWATYWSRLATLAITATAMLFVSGTAKADFIPYLCGDQPSGAGTCTSSDGIQQLAANLWQYKYVLFLTNGEHTQVGGDNSPNYVTIYDVPGYIGNSASSNSDFTASQSLTGVTPSTVSFYDNPNLWNVTWTAQASLANGTYNYVTLESRYGPSLLIGRYSEQVYKDSLNTLDQGDGYVHIPDVPEPATMFLLGSGLLALSFLCRRGHAT